MASALKGKLLIVDDDEDVQKALKRAAESAGFEVLQEFDGIQVWTVARSELPDVILLDVNMPQSDGRDVLKQLKADPITATIPVIICSSRAAQHDRHVGF